MTYSCQAGRLGSATDNGWTWSRDSWANPVHLSATREVASRVRL